MSDRLLERLAEADPARGSEPDERAMEALLARLVATPGAGRPQRRRLRLLVPIGVAALVLAAAGLAAGHKIIFGGAKPRGMFSQPHAGLGAVVPGSVRLLPVRVPDPVGGPPWGMRVFATTRGLGCAEIGRVVGGELGALGRDRAFHDDGRFHRLPVGSLRLGPPKCTSLDANGRVFMNGGIGAVAASGIASCMPPEFTSGVPARELCAPDEERSIDFGVLGPEAASVTYRLGGRLITRPTVGPDGGYLIVAPGADSHGDGVGVMPQVPFDGPIVKVTYRDGTSCEPQQLWGRAQHHRPCIPKGFVAPQASLPTRAQVAAPVHARHLRGTRTIEVRFTARLPVSSTSSAYTLTWRRPHQSKGSMYAIFTQRDIAAGETVRLPIHARGTGVFRGRVVFNSGLTSGFGLPRDGVLVGRFAVRIRAHSH
jgi:hypothetical protein